MLKKQKRRSSINNEKGMAVLELVPIIIVIVLLVNFSLGFFGAIHTGILNSIASRNYAFETFRNRANLTYFRSTPNADVALTYDKVGMRVHGTLSENTKEGANDWVASSRRIDFMALQREAAEIAGTKPEHERTRSLPGGRNETLSVNPIWIKTTYGICLNAECAGTGS
ncbi:hypothetical protein AB1A81_00540 [Bdellovibrio bacteriovorus]|uniref:Uncharacterized protein n=3 Tax=Bdellovibrio bacteriovorus TaxID=959 RepID=Q68VE2_BDEBC|nr:hypothetical protein [Bdellovibrio bacteriovorus]AHZ85764.1 hypothetical protein EP01_12585 [Bdellovibrio bacteriovorus]BEV66684.1 hypothetical protein Bb109J_c0104 [Bdellovibrio bacteriovorus]CAE47777.1 hypothetical protein [Bdellovibrio bacteriovorus]CAE77788.1 hypothetical protein predicted by Glimmer/Critica [Bdellovibrio bacteriovorus HD100]